MDDTTGLPLHDERFSALYAQYSRALVTFCRRMVGPTDAEEVAQEAFLRAWASRDSYSPTRPFWPWLVTIARRICIDRARRRQVAAANAFKAISIFDGVPVERPEEVAESKLEGELARTALADLRPNHRRMLSRRAVDGWSYAQIADAEGVSEEAVRGVLRRARQGLREAYVRVAGSAPVAIPIAALRWARRRVATAPALNIDILRASEVAVVAAAALAIGAGAGSAAQAAAPRATYVSSAQAAAVRHGITGTEPATSARGAAAPRTSSPVASVSAAQRGPVTTVTTAPSSVKLAEIADDSEIDRMCAASDVRVRAGHARVCVDTKRSAETANVLITTRKVDP